MFDIIDERHTKGIRFTDISTNLFFETNGSIYLKIGQAIEKDNSYNLSKSQKETFTIEKRITPLKAKLIICSE